MKVVLVDDSALFRGGLRTLLTTAGVEVVADRPDTAGLDELIGAVGPDVVVLDIRMPPTHTDEGLVAALGIRRRFPDTAVLILSTYPETEYVTRLLRSGGAGCGYLLKDRVGDVRSLLAAMQRVSAGESVVDPELISGMIGARRASSQLQALTDRERAVLGLMAEGHSNAGISTKLFLSAKTVEAHAASIFTKLELTTDPMANKRVIAVLRWLEAPAQV